MTNSLPPNDADRDADYDTSPPKPMTYEQALAIAEQYYGENWYRDCTIRQHLHHDGHLSFAVSTTVAHRGGIKHHPGH